MWNTYWPRKYRMARLIQMAVSMLSTRMMGKKQLPLHEEQDQEYCADGQQVHLDHVGRDGVHQVIGAHAPTGQIIIVRVILLHRGAHPLHQRKGPIALGVGVHRKHHAGVAAGDQQPQRIPGHELRRDGRACVVHIGKDAGHLRDGVQCIRKLCCVAVSPSGTNTT